MELQKIYFPIGRDKVNCSIEIVGPQTQTSNDYFSQSMSEYLFSRNGNIHSAAPTIRLP